MSFERARSPEKKNIRIDQIIDAALALFEQVPYDEINMAKIGKQLDFTRGNIYRYFSTKEEIFLEILQRDMKSWISDLDDTLKNRENIPLEKFAEYWAVSLNTHNRLIRIFALLYSIIEQNVSIDKLAEFKKGFFENVPIINSIFSKQFPKMSENDQGFLIHSILMYAMGLYPMTLESEVQKKAIEKAGVNYEKPNFIQSMKRFIITIIKGTITQG